MILLCRRASRALGGLFGGSSLIPADNQALTLSQVWVDQLNREKRQALREKKIPAQGPPPVAPAGLGPFFVRYCGGGDDDAKFADEDARRRRQLHEQLTKLVSGRPPRCKKRSTVLKRRGLLFVGIDVIGGEWLTEINVTSPTRIVAIERFDGTDVAALIWDAIERKVAA